MVACLLEQINFWVSIKSSSSFSLSNAIRAAWTAVLFLTQSVLRIFLSNGVNLFSLNSLEICNNILLINEEGPE